MTSKPFPLSTTDVATDLAKDYVMFSVVRYLPENVNIVALFFKGNSTRNVEENSAGQHSEEIEVFGGFCGFQRTENLGIYFCDTRLARIVT
jgi:hypothetical protein